MEFPSLNCEIGHRHDNHCHNQHTVNTVLQLAIYIILIISSTIGTQSLLATIAYCVGI